MMSPRYFLTICIALVATTASSWALEGENLLMPIPQGFQPGFHQAVPPSEISEYVPAGETINDWSRMLTIIIAHNLGNHDPEAFAQNAANRWKAACPSGDTRKFGSGIENGYPYAMWQLTCPLNPATGKPETTWTKIIGGADALYDVQYAYRQAISQELVAPAVAALRSIQVCDARGTDHPCPQEMK